MALDWQGVLQGLFAGMAGDPMAPMRQKQMQFQMQQAMEKLKMEKEQHDIESKYRAALMKKMEFEMQQAQQANQPMGDFMVPEMGHPGVAAEYQEPPGMGQEYPETDYVPTVETTTQAEGNAPGTGQISPPIEIGGANVTSMKERLRGIDIFQTPGKPTGKVDIQQSLMKLFGKGTASQVQKVLPALDILRKVQTPEKETPESYDKWVDPMGNVQYLVKGSEIPPGWMPYEKEGKEAKPSYDLFEDKQGNPVYIEKGKPIPKGLKPVKQSAATVNVNLEKSTKGGIEKDIVEKTSQIDSLKDVAAMFKEEYLTIPGEAKAFGQKWLDKFGVAPESDFLEKRSQWFATAQQNLLAYRKWITGVAGGEREYGEIAKAFPDPAKNSPTEFKAKLRQTISNGVKLNKRLAIFLAAGVDKPTTEQLASINLSQIKLSPEEQSEIDNLFGKQVVQIGKEKETGRKVIRYSDGSIDYGE